MSVSAWLGNKSVKTEIEIEAPPVLVWQVLTDVASYQHWNPVFLYEKGDLKQGENIIYTVTENPAEQKSAKISARVKQVVPNKLLNQTGGLWGIITFDHKYLLTKTERGTKVTIYEKYTGLYVNFWGESSIAKQYENLAKALKTRVLSSLKAGVEVRPADKTSQ
ncbi:SRPBCC domain-containing protein [Thalassotalea euphylliae]|uniref:SRPBCC domain-containing protein n=2 Tax=Thalassotalea euphylliae TaxID=1655234 RepID=A0A3E0ULR0_9GAMM|nr:SRPBCC domain-containing protein [Thalassotalea euphylliae]